MWLRSSNLHVDGQLASWSAAAFIVGIALFCHGCGSTGSVRPDLGAAAAVGDPELGPVVSPAARAAYDEAIDALGREDFVEAELNLEQFVLAYPQYAGAYVNLAIVYEQEDRHEESLAALDQALTIDPDHAAANNQLGMVLRKQGRFAEAEQAYLRALAADPVYRLAHHNLGVLLDLYLHRPAEALQHYRRYQELGAEPDATVGRWIIDLERRVGANEDAARLAQGDGT